MSVEPVDVFVKDSTPSALPVEGVLVKIYNQAGTLFFTQGITDSNGQVSFLLETQTYSARFYKFQVGFTQPQLLEVLEAQANQFDVVAEVFVLPLATDARFCRASGFFRNITGSPHAYLDIHISGKFDPIILEGAAVVDNKDITRTDAEGFACIDLIRGAIYDVMLEGLETCHRCVKVPDQGSVNLPDLLFPVVKSVSLTPDGPYLLTVGSELVLTPVVIATDGRPLEPASGSYDVQWNSTDTSVVAVKVSNDTITLRGVGIGSAQVTATRSDQSIIRVPNTPIEGQPLEVTVS